MYRRFLFFFFVLILITGCSIEKRHYRTGWYIDKSGKSTKTAPTSPEILEAPSSLAQQTDNASDSISLNISEAIDEVNVDSAKKEVPNAYSVVHRMRSFEDVTQGLSIHQVVKNKLINRSESEAALDDAQEEQLRSDANFSLFLITLAYLCLVAAIIMLSANLLPVYLVIISAMSVILAIASCILSIRTMKAYRKAENKKLRGREVAELALALGISYIALIMLPLLTAGLILLIITGGV